MAEETDGKRIKAVAKTLTIVETLQGLDGARVTELAEKLDWPESTVHNHLSTLRNHDYVIKEGDVYHIGLKFLNVGGYALHRKGVYEMVQTKVNELAEATQERAQFVVEEHGRGIYLWTATGNNAVQIDARIGKRNRLHASSAGKAILAFLPRSEVEAIIDRQGLEQLTENTITDRDVLFDELEEIREQGYGFNREESVPGLQAVGVPVVENNDRVVGGLSVSGPANRMKGEWFDEEIPDLLLGTANEIELNIKY